MFRNLEAEMARRGISTRMLADMLGVAQKTARNKLNGTTEFTLSEIRKICEAFPGCEWPYLFKANCQNSA